MNDAALETPFTRFWSAVNEALRERGQIEMRYGVAKALFDEAVAKAARTTPRYDVRAPRDDQGRAA